MSDELVTGVFTVETVAGAPIDMLERYFGANGWSSERSGDEEIVATVEAAWGRYEVRALWREEDQVLQIVGMPGLQVPPERRAAGYELIGRINEQLWLGHFDLWSNDGQVLYRHAALLRADGDGDEGDDMGGGLSLDQASAFVDAAIDECDRYYPALEFLIAGEHDPQQALAAALIDVQGEA